MRYKIGQTVRVLPSAVGYGVYTDDVGMLSKVIKVTGEYTLDIESSSGFVYPWHVRTNHIEYVNQVGKQLLLWNDL